MNRIAKPKTQPQPATAPAMDVAMQELWSAPVTGQPGTEKGKFVPAQMCYVQGRSAEIVVVLGRFGKRDVVVVKSRNRDNGSVHRFAMSLAGFGALLTAGQAVMMEQVKGN